MSKKSEYTICQLNNSEYIIRQEKSSDFRVVENLTREAFWNVYRPGCLEHYVLHCYRDNPDFIPELSLVLKGPAPSCGDAAGCGIAADVGTAVQVAGEGPRREILAHVMFAWSEILVDPRDDSSEEPRRVSGEEPRRASGEEPRRVSGEEPLRLRMLTFGPISVRPDMQRKGLGKLLLDYALERAREMGGGCVAMCGNFQFYGKCGFVPAASRGIRYADDPEGDAPYFLIRELTPGFLDGVSGSYRDPAAYFVDEREADEFDKLFPSKEKLVLPGQLC